jgi:hypothetical protein
MQNRKNNIDSTHKKKYKYKSLLGDIIFGFPIFLQDGMVQE